MQIKLNERLLAMTKLVLHGKPVADIGTDHSYLPVYLVLNSICPSVIATERARGPYDNACQLVELLSLTRQIELRLGDGLTVLKPGEAATVCIAGMGGYVIRDILDAAPQVLSATERLVLQPQKNAPMLRRYLQQAGWRIIDEDIAFDHGFYYEVMAAEPGRMELSEDEAMFGPCLLGQPHPLLPQYLGLKLADMQTLADQLEGKQGQEAQERLRTLHGLIEQIERILGGAGVLSPRGQN